VVTVDLVAMAAPAAAPVAGRAARPAPARRAAEAPTPVPKPEPPKPAPPAPEPPRREAALPKSPTPPEPKKPEPRKPRERTPADPKPEPEPKRAEAPRPEPKPQPEPPPEPARAAAPAAPKKPEPARPPPRQEEAYDDVLAQLRQERGESRPGRVASATPSAGVAGASGVAGAAVRGAGQPMSPDVAVWLRAARFHVESAWIVPPGFQRESLRTVVSVRLDAGGRVLGAPRVTERSANPWYDESVVRAIQKASPLPPPPEPGEWRFEFTPPGSTG
jgi:colicin import membrane protein